MIQRIQTVFLLLTVIVTGLLFYMPVITLNMPGATPEQTDIFQFYTTKYIQAGTPPVFIEFNWFSMVLNILITGLAFLSIFLYKKRFLQLRLCLVNIILMLGIIILVSVQAYNITKPDGEWHLNLAFAFPIIGIILTWLALRGIVKDIALLKSYDRIR
ncbi:MULTISPECIES: DUF4293 domain-containing protein [Culturomica]|jgi:hypothetical protein|uniref:DUF4293 domain-containing protein n=1 Tax=Culturomica TaxID=1926651 RepID=UPI00033809E1|nr:MULTISPECIES: DUF4293 domain-containing protein [Culturomica]CCZ06495.1 putative uncharacterized protein [Odoribacter sp. CAG:788]HBO25291.1 DUF4293 domain-containing protein [Culturomica sp.]